MHRRLLTDLASIPGTGLSSRGLFVSRRSALFTAESHAATRLHPAIFSPGALDALFAAGVAGWKLYLIGNEDAVARGKTSDVTWQRFEESLLAHLKGLGIAIQRHYACVDHPQGKGTHQRDSVFRFPNTGALYHAAQEDGIELGASWIVSRDAQELTAGWRAGCHTAGLEKAPALASGKVEVDTTLRGVSFAKLVREIVATGDLARR